MAASSPRLGDVLRLLWPTPQETLFLRACLGSGDAAATAWAQWGGGIGDPKQVLMRDAVGLKRHLPLLYDNLQRHGVSISRRLAPYLRAAHLRESLRAKHYRQYLHDALDVVGRAGLRVVVVKGAAISETSFPDPSLRHSHDVDLLVERNEVADVAMALGGAGFAPLPDGPRGGDRRVRHASGLPIELHTEPFPCPFYPAPVDAMRQRASTVLIAGVPTRVLCPADMLVHVCGHASTTRRRDTLAWAIDACLLVRRHPDLAWDVALDVSGQSHLALPLHALFLYLSRELDAPIPARVIAKLADQAARTDRLRREAALHGVRQGRRGRFVAMLRPGGWRARLDVVAWLLLPSPRYLAWACNQTSPWGVALSYLRRPLGYVLRRVARGVRGGARPRRSLRPDRPAAEPVVGASRSSSAVNRT